MKRKVNLVGQNTLTVSLPSKWVKKNNIQKGDEIELSEVKNSLILGKDYKPKLEKTTIDVSGQASMVHRIMAATYKAGYDEVEVRYSTPEELKIIQDRIDRNLTEFDIVEYRQNSIHVKSIARVDEEHFDTIFKRCFFSMNDIADDTHKAISSKDYDELKNIIIRDKSIDKYTDYCRRLLNKGVDAGFNRPKSIYYILEEIEIIADIYKDICQEVIDKKMDLSPDLKVLLKEVISFSKDFTGLLFKFSWEGMKKVGSEREALNKKIDKLYSKVKKEELKLFFMILQAFNATFEMKSALITEFV